MSFICIRSEKISITKKGTRRRWNSNGPHAISKALWFYFRFIYANTLSLSLRLRHHTKTNTCVHRMSFGNVVTIHWFRSFNAVVAVTTMTMVYGLFNLSPFDKKENKCVTKCWAADLILVIFSATLIFSSNLFVRLLDSNVNAHACLCVFCLSDIIFILNFFRRRPNPFFLLLDPFLGPLIYSNFMA